MSLKDVARNLSVTACGGLLGVIIFIILHTVPPILGSYIYQDVIRHFLVGILSFFCITTYLLIIVCVLSAGGFSNSQPLVVVVFTIATLITLELMAAPMLLMLGHRGLVSLSDIRVYDTQVTIRKLPELVKEGYNAFPKISDGVVMYDKGSSFRKTYTPEGELLESVYYFLVVPLVPEDYNNETEPISVWITKRNHIPFDKIDVEREFNYYAEFGTYKNQIMLNRNIKEEEIQAYQSAAQKTSQFMSNTTIFATQSSYDELVTYPRILTALGWIIAIIAFFALVSMHTSTVILSIIYTDVD